MKIGVVVKQFPVVSETFVLDHIGGLYERHHDVDVFCRELSLDMPAPRQLLPAAVENRVHEWLPSASAAGKIRTGLSALLAAPPAALARAIKLGLGELPRDTLPLGNSIRRRLGSTTLLHAHFGPVGEQLAFLKRAGLLYGPLLVSLHGYDVSRNIAALRKQYRYLFSTADRIVVTTGFMADRASNLGCADSKIVRNPIGIRLARFPFRPRSLTPGAPLRILSTARLVEKKGIEFALRAVGRLVARGQQVEYRIAGDGPLRTSLETLARQLGIAHCVHFLGALQRAAVEAELAHGQVFLFPSVTAADGDQEGQGMALIEAQACGMPCVASRSGGIPEVLQDAVNGYLVAERDDAAIAAAIERLVERSAEWPAMAAEGRRWVESRFDLERHLNMFDQLYAELRDGVA